MLLKKFFIQDCEGRAIEVQIRERKVTLQDGQIQKRKKTKIGNYNHFLLFPNLQ